MWIALNNIMSVEMNYNSMVSLYNIVNPHKRFNVMYRYEAVSVFLRLSRIYVPTLKVLLNSCTILDTLVCAVSDDLLAVGT